MSADATTTFSLRGRVVLVVGASSGLGAHFARVLARAGADVVIVAARRADKLAALAREISSSRREGCLCKAVNMDVSDSDSIKKGVLAAEQAAGGRCVDVLVNCAGVARSKRALDMLESDWDHVLRVNLKGNFFVAQAVARRLVDRGQPGNIVNVASILGLRPGSRQANYGASKAGLLHVTRIMAHELSAHNIRVNALCPGYFASEMTDAFFASEAGVKYLQNIPPTRLGRLHELDGPILLLASDASSFMTGTHIVVDLGHTNAAL
jgi:NAD(P)-dependent dehydrogenase (short-subunit alcohol dehydrogenase family)